MAEIISMVGIISVAVHRAESSNVFGKKLSEMLKFPARESYCFRLIVFVLTRQEMVKNNNTYCSRIQVAFLDIHEEPQGVKFLSRNLIS